MGMGGFLSNPLVENAGDSDDELFDDEHDFFFQLITDPIQTVPNLFEPIIVPEAADDNDDDDSFGDTELLNDEALDSEFDDFDYMMSYDNELGMVSSADDDDDDDDDDSEWQDMGAFATDNADDDDDDDDADEQEDWDAPMVASSGSSSSSDSTDNDCNADGC